MSCGSWNAHNSSCKEGTAWIWVHGAYKRQRQAQKAVSPFSSISHDFPLGQWFKSESNCLVNAYLLRRARQAGSLGREQSPWWILQPLGVCRFRESFSSPQGLCFGSLGTHTSWLRRSGYVNQIHFITLQWEAALSTGRLVLVWQSHLLPVGGLIKVCQNTWKLWTTNP